MTFLYLLYSFSYTGGIVKDYENIDLGQCLPAFEDKIINCPILNFECWNQSSKSGAIVSPNLPHKVSNESFFGKVCKFIYYYFIACTCLI